MKKTFDTVLNVCNRVFGEAVSYQPMATEYDDQIPPQLITPEPRNIKGVFRYTFIEINGVGSMKPTLSIKLSDLDVAPQEGDQVTMDNKTFEVISSQPDTFGSSLLILEVV